MTPGLVDVVVPTVGRASLRQLLHALAAGSAPLPGRVILVDDRRRRHAPLLRAGLPSGLASRVGVLPGDGAGPAAARNRGWRASRAEWIAFLDDDVVPSPTWAADLLDDLGRVPAGVAGSQGRVTVPRPAKRRPTDWERATIGLERAAWATADMAYRRRALVSTGGFDARFRRAYREDADLALRVRRLGFGLARGRRRVVHPVRPAPPWVSVAVQAGNADDVLMRRLHGPGWRAAAAAPPGRLPRHLAVTAAGLLAAAAALAGAGTAAALAATLWAAGTAELAWARIAPGPRTTDEIARMLLTSLALPAAAAFHHVRGRVRWRGVRRLDAVLLDRDGTIVVDVPYNGDPARVAPMPTARAALDRLRAAGVRVAVVSNQGGVAKGLLTLEQVWAVNRRVEELLGPFAAFEVCPHGPRDRCGCRKPRPGLLRRAMARLGVRPQRTALIGDTGADVDAARAAGVRPVLVPTPVTRAAEVAAAPEVARDLAAAVDRLLGSRP